MSESTRKTIGAGKPPRLTRAGGGLGIASCAIGLLIFLGGCFGQQAAFLLGFLPAAMGLVGLTLAIVGGRLERHHAEPTHVLAALLLNLWGILGGVILMAVAYRWPIFPGTANA